MIAEERIKDKEGLELLKEALRDLIIRVPLAGFSLLGESIEIHEDPTCVTYVTDGRKIWYDPAWLKAKDLRNRIWDVLHEWLHIFKNDPKRCGDRDAAMWNTAVDITVLRECLLLLGSTFLPTGIPPDGVQIPNWAGDKTSEEIYDLLKEGASTECGTDPGIPSASDIRGDGADEYTQEEEDCFQEKFREELAQAHLIIEQASPGKLPDSIRSRLDEILKDSINWAHLLRGNLLADLGGPVATYVPLNRRFLGQRYPLGEPVIRPSFRNMKEQVLLLGIDVSASVGKTLMDRFIANVMPAAARARRTHVVTFDQEVREHVCTTSPRSLLSIVKFNSGAHYTTDVRPVFDIADEIRPSSICILTDAYVHYPTTPYPDTRWVVPINGGTPPWGHVYTMKVAW